MSKRCLAPTELLDVLLGDSRRPGEVSAGSTSSGCTTSGAPTVTNVYIILESSPGAVLGGLLAALGVKKRRARVHPGKGAR